VYEYLEPKSGSKYCIWVTS